MSIPSKIKALLQPDYQSTHLILGELDTPIAKPDSDEHLIRVYATSPCAGELLWAKNFAFITQSGKESTPCYDLAGVVVKAPADSPFQPGAEVYTRTPATRTGNAKEYTIALTSELALKPKNLSWEQAASVPLSLFTAYQALFVHGGLTAPWKDKARAAENANKRVLVTAAAGGVGVWIVQLAKISGVKEIVAVAGPNNIEFVKELGATEFINYREQSIGEWVKAGNTKADIVIDAIGGKSLSESWTAVREGGIIMSIRQPPSSKKAESGVVENVKDIFFIMESDGWQLKEATDLIERGLVKPVVDSVWELEDFEKAFDIAESGHARGKVVLKL